LQVGKQHHNRGVPLVGSTRSAVFSLEHCTRRPAIVYLGLFPIEGPFPMTSRPDRIWSLEGGFDGHRWDLRWERFRWEWCLRPM